MAWIDSLDAECSSSCIACSFDDFTAIIGIIFKLFPWSVLGDWRWMTAAWFAVFGSRRLMGVARLPPSAVQMDIGMYDGCSYELDLTREVMITAHGHSLPLWRLR